MTSIVFLISGCSNKGVDNIKKENKYVSMVKNGHPDKYPDSTYGKSFDKFFGSPTWKYFKSDDGKDVVEFTGDCKYENVKVKSKLQFILDVDSGTFEAGALSFNEVPQNKLITASLLNKVFEESIPETSSLPNNESSNTNQKPDSSSSTESSNTSNINNDNQEEFYGKWIISKAIASSNVRSFSEEDINKIIGQQLSFSKDQSSSFGDEINNMKNIVTNPTYKKSIVFKNDFVSNYRASFDNLGIKDDSITEITVLNSKDIAECTFFLKDENTLILYGGGVFFQLNKK